MYLMLTGYLSISYRVLPLNPPCRVGRQQWVRGAGLRPPGRLLAQDFLRAVRAFVLVGNMGVMRGVVLQ